MNAGISVVSFSSARKIFQRVKYFSVRLEAKFLPTKIFAVQAFLLVNFDTVWFI